MTSMIQRLISTTIMMLLSMIIALAIFAQDQQSSGSASNSQNEPQTPPAAGSEQTPVDSQPVDLPLAPTAVPEELKFQYNPQGARDPFVSLIEKQQDPRIRPPGLAGMQISEITLQGIQIGLGRVAIFKGSDNKAYPLREGESVFDGKLIEIHNHKAVFEKVLLDPFGREKEKQKIEVYLHRE